MKIIKYFLEAILVYFLFFLIKIIGLNLARKIISNLFLIFGPLIRSDKIIKKNISIVFGEKDENEGEKRSSPGRQLGESRPGLAAPHERKVGRGVDH